MRSRSGLVTAAAVLVALAPPAEAADAAAGASGNAPAGSAKASAGVAAPSDVDGLKPIRRPNERYVGATCAIDLSGIADFTELDHVEGCGLEIDFDAGMLKRTVGATWGTWGTPPHTESATPNVLHRFSGPTSVTLTLSKRSSVTGFEAEPGPFSVHDISATFATGAGVALGTITRSIDGEGGARLLAARVRKVRSITISSDDYFAIAQIRVKL